MLPAMLSGSYGTKRQGIGLCARPWGKADPVRRSQSAWYGDRRNDESERILRVSDEGHDGQHHDRVQLHGVPRGKSQLSVSDQGHSAECSFGRGRDGAFERDGTGHKTQTQHDGARQYPRPSCQCRAYGRGGIAHQYLRRSNAEQ